MNYCLVQNGAIIDGPRALPTSWENISGLHLLGADRLKELGWLPHRIIELTGQHKVMTNTVFTISEDEVVESYESRDMTADEIAAETEAHWSSVRQERNQKLKDSDYTQLGDASLSDADKLNWATYRQALRDVTKQANPNNIQWPQKPGSGVGVAIL